MVLLLVMTAMLCMWLQVMAREAESSLSSQQRSNFKMVVVNNKPMHSWYNWLTAAGISEDQVEVFTVFSCVFLANPCWLIHMVVIFNFLTTSDDLLAHHDIHTCSGLLMASDIAAMFQANAVAWLQSDPSMLTRCMREQLHCQCGTLHRL